jgi:hypothetical protein
MFSFGRVGNAAYRDIPGVYVHDDPSLAVLRSN